MASMTETEGWARRWRRGLHYAMEACLGRLSMRHSARKQRPVALGPTRAPPVLQWCRGYFQLAYRPGQEPAETAHPWRVGG